MTTWLTPSALVSRSRTSICQPPDPPRTSLAFGYFFRVLLISPTSSRNFLFVYAVSFPPSVNIMLTGPRPIGSIVEIQIILVLLSNNLETCFGSSATISHHQNYIRRDDTTCRIT